MIYLITPCVRPENLETMRESIPSWDSHALVTWVIVYDSMVKDPKPITGAINLISPYTGCYGNPNRNHPDWYGAVSPYLDDYQFLKWGQLHGKPGYESEIRLPSDSPIKKRHIDTACYMVRWDIQKNIRYIDWRTADFTMAEEVSKVCDPVIIPHQLCYYNYLRYKR